jgi:twitching motility protein PilT
MERFHNLVNSGVVEGYSDIHISGDHHIVCRKNGKILFINDRYTCEQIDELVLKLLKPHELEMLRRRLSVDLARSVGHIRIRMNIFNTTRGLSIAVRLLPGRIPNFSDLNLIPDLKKYCGMGTGLVLICGATGSGKSTTIAAFLSEINRNYERHIITLEDPVEYRFNSGKCYIEQRELGTHIRSFEQGLQDVLREDPDVIVVGELRDPETIKLTLNAVESGHLVLASLHATNSEDALYRMCNSFPSDAQDMVRTQLSSVLSLLIVQKLEYLPRFGFRVPILSLLTGTNAVKATIRDNRFSQIESILQTARKDGMYTQEKYESDFINSKRSLTSPDISFRPSTETADSRIYSSPVVDPARQAGAVRYDSMPPVQGDRARTEETVLPETARQEQEITLQEPVPYQEGDERHYVISGTTSMEDAISELTSKIKDR